MQGFHNWLYFYHLEQNNQAITSDYSKIYLHNLAPNRIFVHVRIPVHSILWADIVVFFFTDFFPNIFCSYSWIADIFSITSNISFYFEFIMCFTKISTYISESFLRK